MDIANKLNQDGVGNRNKVVIKGNIESPAGNKVCAIES